MWADRITEFQPKRGWIGGVCASFAAETGIHVALWRVGAVMVLLWHAGLALVLYLLAALFWARRPAAAVLGPQADQAMRSDMLRRAREDALARAFYDLERRR